MTLFLQQLRIVTETYLKEYDRNWMRFEQSFNLKNRIKTKSSEENLKSAYMRLRNQQGSDLIARDFIRTLEKGNILLEYIRQVLTGQTITTTFTIKGSENEIYMTDKSEVPYRLVLSTYGASGNNFVSLAYDINVDKAIQTLTKGLTENEKRQKMITSSDIYSRIDVVKKQYLDDLNSKYPKKKYKPIFDSKDVEIFDLLSQRLASQEISSLNQALTKSTYIKMRKAMGGRGGYRTSSTQLGDVGLIQDKLITQKTNQVNFARQTLIRGRFESLNQALMTMNHSEIKNTFLKLFTEKQSRVGDNVSRMVNREAVKMIREAFKGVK